MPDDPFHFDVPPGSRLRRAAFTVARPLLARALGTRTIAALYGQRGTDPVRFSERSLELLDIQADCPSADLARIPACGPLLIVANHPHGALDGLLLDAVLRRVRRDIRLLANGLLARIPELRECCFFVDPFGGPEAAIRSRAGLRAAHLWLRAGGALVVFPSGEVAAARDAAGVPIESPWRDTAGRLALQTGAQVVPAFIEGANSALFYAAGRLNPWIRTALLGRELLRQRGHRVALRFGGVLPARGLQERSGADAATATGILRGAVEALGARGRALERRAEALPHRQVLERRAEALPHNESIEGEVGRLQDACLAEGGGFQVFCAEATRIPAALREIGRLRAITYRAVGEGTGADLDLDTFDERYLHLFSWDRRQRRIVGAYRIARTDRIVREAGVDGLYTRTLFRYDQAFIDRLSPALELGRSFVRAEYQRNYNALLLLWKGIGRWVVKHPEYRVLFGPVSISTRYSDSSHAMLVAFLAQNHLDASVSELVAAVNPVNVRQSLAALPASVPRTAGEVDRLIASFEKDGKGMPVLLRQYLKLNARLIGFNVDPDFGEVLDALMMVDLTTVDPAILSRYLGAAEAASFLARHRTAAA